MTYNQMPKAQGLYRPEFEHDACGIGLYAQLKGVASHDIVKKGLNMLCQLDHRGGQGSGQGCGKNGAQDVHRSPRRRGGVNALSTTGRRRGYVMVPAADPVSLPRLPAGVFCSRAC